MNDDGPEMVDGRMLGHGVDVFAVESVPKTKVYEFAGGNVQCATMVELQQAQNSAEDVNESECRTGNSDL